MSVWEQQELARLTAALAGCAARPGVSAVLIVSFLTRRPRSGGIASVGLKG